jgi:hypothetical protein
LGNFTGKHEEYDKCEDTATAEDFGRFEEQIQGELSEDGSGEQHGGTYDDFLQGKDVGALSELNGKKCGETKSSTSSAGTRSDAVGDGGGLASCPAECMEAAGLKMLAKEAKVAKETFKYKEANKAKEA